MSLGIGEAYLPVVQIGLQTLCIIAAGRLAASRGLFDAAPVCRTLNRFVVVVCLPALQFWLLAIKTDMRNMEHWRAVGAFMLWTLLVQMGCTAWVLIFEGGKLSRICVHSLVLAANNTGILAPVVLEAAVGPSAAAVGMLATIVLYFQQLPAAMVLFELDRISAERACANSNTNTNVNTNIIISGGGGDGGGGSVNDDVISLAQAAAYRKENVAPTSHALSTSAPLIKLGVGDVSGDVNGDAGDGGRGWRMGDGKGGDLHGCGRDGGNGHGGGSDPWARSSPSKGGSGWSGEMVGASHGGGENGGGGGMKVPGEVGGGRTAAGGGVPVLVRGERLGSSKANGRLRAWTAGGGRKGSATATVNDSGRDRDGATAATAAAGAAALAPGGEDADGGNGDGVERAMAPAGMSIDHNLADGACADVCTASTAGVAMEGKDRHGFWSAFGSPSRPDDPNLHHRHVHHPPQQGYPQQLLSSRIQEDQHPHSHRRRAVNPPPPICRQSRQLLPYSVVVSADTAVSVDACSSSLPGLQRAIASTSGGGRNGRSGTSPSFSTSSSSPSKEEPSLRHVAQLVLGNALMWTTGAATGVSMLGLHAVLDPDVPSHVRGLQFVEGTLAWLAKCSVPVSLFAMGLFSSNTGPGCGVDDARSARTVVSYLAVKLLVLPWVMVFVNSLLGLDGQLAQALLVLTCVPVGQNAFLVTEQFGEGAEVVTAVMQAGLLLMLPHVAGLMAGLRWMGLYQGATT